VDRFGVNHQFHRVVLGLELSGSWNGASGSSVGTIPAFTFTQAPIACLASANNGSGISATVACNAKQLWTAQLLAKFGYAIGDGRLLPYVTGGIALTELDAGVNGTLSTAPPITVTSAARKTIAGSVLGVGAQYAFGHGWSAGAEYLYTRYNSQDFSSIISCSPTPCFPANPNFVTNHDLATQTARLVVNFKFPD
jgi:opacity protein-like surface antigen